jgi:hypothetical protein
MDQCWAHLKRATFRRHRLIEIARTMLRGKEKSLSQSASIWRKKEP